MIHAALPALLLAAGAAGALSPEEARGRQLFLRGTGASGQAVAAVVGDAPVSAPMPCAGCHGARGQGGAEGGVRAPPLTWDALSRPSAGRGASGRPRPAYDGPRQLVRAIAMGLDSGGRALAPAMPRYQLLREDAGDLVVFLRRLGTLRDPGVGDGALTLGVLLPEAPADPASPRARLRELLRAAAEAWAGDANARGGIYTRRLELRFVDRPSAEDEPFAFIGWGDDGVAAWMAEHEVPFVRVAGGTAAAAGFAFDVGPSPADEVGRLVELAASRGQVPLAVAGPEADAGAPLAAAARAACQPPRCRLAASSAAARAVLCLDAACLRGMPAHAVALVPSLLAEEAVSAAPPGGAVLAARASPPDIDPAAAARYRLAPARLADQWSLLAAARLVEHVLQRAGADLTRASFISTLRTTRNLATGFSPPLSFDADRSRGTDTVRLLRLDPGKDALTPVE